MGWVPTWHMGKRETNLALTSNSSSGETTIPFSMSNEPYMTCKRALSPTSAPRKVNSRVHSVQTRAGVGLWGTCHS